MFRRRPLRAGDCEPSWAALGSGIEGAAANPLVVTLMEYDNGDRPALFAGGLIGTYALAMTVFDDGLGSGTSLYVGGSFSLAGGVLAPGIAKWNGTEWAAVGGGVSGGLVRALAVFQDSSSAGPALIAGGTFTAAGGVPANYIAEWNGEEWSALGSGVTGGNLNSLAVFDDGSGSGPALYAGGHFSTAGGSSVNRIAKWDGQTWSDVGGGVTGGDIGPNVWALLAVDEAPGLGGPALYAAGDFHFAGGAPASYIAAWDGSAWRSLGSGLSFQARALAMFDDGSGSGPALYVGGLFGFAGGIPVGGIAKWDGLTWSALDGGANGSVRALTVFAPGASEAPKLIAGGDFTMVGGLPANRIAAWGCDAPKCAAADLNCDGVVDVFDLLILLSAWGECADPNDCPADLNGDGVVDVFDLLILLSHWG